MDLPALQQVNSDVIGWIAIPGTEISYPLVQGTDNDYYLTHTWNQNSSAVGAIFMDCRCSADFSGFNTIVYGHRMNNGSMFAALKHYKKQDFLQAHPQVYVTNASGTHAYSIYAAYEAALDGTAYYSAFSDETIKKTFINEGVSLSVIRTGAVPTVNDHILTLSTCTGNGHASAGGHGIKKHPACCASASGMLLYTLILPRPPAWPRGQIHPFRVCAISPCG